MKPNAKRIALPKSRPPLERMMRIHQAIAAGKYPNATTLAREIEVVTKTIHRDIEFMRDRLGLPIEYDGRRFGYHYTEEVSSFPTLQITEGELVALLIAEKALQQYRGTPFEKPLLSAFQKMESSLPDNVSFNFADWDRTISFRHSVEPIVNLEVFDALAKATVQNRQLELQYRKPGSKQTELRVVDPYHLANINGEWFLFAFDHLRRDIRTFVPARIQSTQQTGKSFARPPKFSVEKILRDSFGVVSGAGEHRVVIRFDAAAADYIREKRWHPSQELRELAGDRLELRMKLSSLGEIQRWILSWGGSAEAVAPPELVESVWVAAKRIAGRSQ
jgi:predicted DNA-binding transcriptional regulator YafY